MAWGTPVEETVSAIDNLTEKFFTEFTLAPSDTVDIQVQGTSSGSTDGLDISVYSSADNIRWDTVPIYPMQLTATTVAAVVSISISGKPYIKIGLLSSGATDTFTADLVASIGTP